MAVLTTLLPKRNFELIRDAIAAILATELTNQCQLGQTAGDKYVPQITKVWLERVIAFDSRTELPTVNVNYAGVDYTLQNRQGLAGPYLYNIDIYTNSTFTETDRGDELAMLRMERAAGMVIAILSAPAFLTLGLGAGIVGGMTIQSFNILGKDQVKDALNDVVGRIQVAVRTTETIVITDTPVPLLQATTLINEGDKGIYYDFDPVE